MRMGVLLGSFAVLLLSPPTFVQAAPRARSTIEDSIEVLNELAGAPEKGVPPALLREASAVLIAPDVIKGGFVFAGRRGHGVLLIREKDAGWSDPVFVTITGASVGLQVGVQATDVFLVIRSRKSLERLLRGNGKLTLGADASLSAGPIGRDLSAGTDAMLRAEILSYSRSRGVFAGVSLEGDTLQIDSASNSRYYGRRDVTVVDIVTGKMATHEGAAVLRNKLANWPDKKIEIEVLPPATLELPPVPPRP